MLLPDVTALLDDPSIGGGQPFVVKRTIRTFDMVDGDTTATKTFHATGNIQPSGSVGLQQTTPEDRQNVTMCIRSTFTFQLGGDMSGGQQDTDKVIYDGKIWRVLQVQDWSKWGYTIAYITLDKGAVL